MKKKELKEFLENRKPSPGIRSFDVEKLVCYGCVHSAAGVEFPSHPSGERPCCSCIRNPQREEWAKDAKEMHVSDAQIMLDDQGHARLFDAFQGMAYNGGPYVYFPQDNYVTFDIRGQEEWLAKHPEYSKPISFDAAGNPVVVSEEN